MSELEELAENNQEEIEAEKAKSDALDERAKKLGAVTKLIVEDDNGPVIAYMKKVDRTTYSACIKLLEQDAIKANETLLRTCLIKEVSDMRIVEDDDVFFSVLPQLRNVISLKKSTLTKL
jgi:hypothetical protein